VQHLGAVAAAAVGLEADEHRAETLAYICRMYISVREAGGTMSAAKTRINMRIDEENLALIKEAADANGQDMTSFVLGAALDRARAVVLEARVTRPSASEAERLEAALDREPRVIPELVELLREAQAHARRAQDEAQG